MANDRPAGVTANRTDRILTIQWEDGHLSAYPFSLLRYACPCAQCRGGHENMHADPDPEVFYLPDVDSSETRIQNVESVGTYALTIHWEDGHSYGIYNWNYLRKLCPCDACRPSYT
jgi:DUF971 family protein